LPQPDPVVIRLVLIDDQTLFREGLRALVEREPDLEVVGEAAGVEGLEALNVEPDVVVTSLGSAESAREDVIKRIRQSFAVAAIVALTDHDDVATIRHVLGAGANGYVLRSAAKADFLAGVRAVARGGLYLQPSIGMSIGIASRSPDEAKESAVGGLTPKETEVLELLALGHTNAEIAARIGSSIRTIETHRAHIHQRLDLHTRAELVRFALDAGLLRLDAHDARS